MIIIIVKSKLKGEKSTKTIHDMDSGNTFKRDDDSLFAWKECDREKDLNSNPFTRPMKETVH